MPDLKFEIISAEVKAFAAMPTLVFRMQISNSVENEEVYAAALKCQVMIEAIRRGYDPETKERLFELFGETERWSETLRTLLWTFVTVPVPRFTRNTIIDISISCSEDQAIAAGKYFYAVRDGNIPLAFLFSGTLFYKGPHDNLQIMQVPWEKEAAFIMPASLWQKMMDEHFPCIRWLRIRKDIYDKLVKYKAQSSFPTFEKAVESLLMQALQENKEIENLNA
jgi:hypothetical protein